VNPADNRRFDGVRPAYDERDNRYLVRSLHLPVTVDVTKMWFADGWWGNQGSTPHCVAYAFTHWLNDGPQLFSLFRHRRPGVDTREIYCEAQKVDEWEGDCDNPQYDGTSIRAGAKVMQARGFIEHYYWARSVDELIQAVQWVGPVVIGTYWYHGMSWPDRDGFIYPGGTLQGAHATVVNGVDMEAEVIRLKNSWGRHWGDNGHAWMHLADFTRLFNIWCDACVLTQRTPAAVETRAAQQDDEQSPLEHQPALVPQPA
jgi:hypothetical protein